MYSIRFFLNSSCKWKKMRASCYFKIFYKIPGDNKPPPRNLSMSKSRDKFSTTALGLMEFVNIFLPRSWRQLERISDGVLWDSFNFQAFSLWTASFSFRHLYFASQVEIRLITLQWCFKIFLLIHSKNSFWEFKILNLKEDKEKFSKQKVLKF